MAQITPDWISDRRKLIEGEIIRMRGALEMLALIEEQIAAPEAEALTLDDLKRATGADSVEVIPHEKGENNNGL